jgi:hypothetical protein
MTNNDLRAALETKEGQRAYSAAIGTAQAEGIRAYRKALAKTSAVKAREIGEAAKNATLLALMQKAGA